MQLPRSCACLQNISWQSYPFANEYISQMNHAVRFVASRAGLDVIDYEPLGAQLSVDEMFRYDGFHPIDSLSALMLNLILNDYYSTL